MIPSFDLRQYGLPLFMLVHKPPQLCFVISIIQFLLSATAEYVINLVSQLNSQKQYRHTHNLVTATLLLIRHI